MSKIKKVAVIQHDADSAELSKMLLEPLGYEVVVLDYANDPVFVIKECHPDVLIMDFSPHAGHCWDVLECLIDDPDTAYLPVVAIASSEKPIRAALARASMAEVILRPFDIDELIKKVNSALAMQDCPDEASA